MRLTGRRVASPAVLAGGPSQVPPPMCLRLVPHMPFFRWMVAPARSRRRAGTPVPGVPASEPLKAAHMAALGPGGGRMSQAPCVPVRTASGTTWAAKTERGRLPLGPQVQGLPVHSDAAQRHRGAQAVSLHPRGCPCRTGMGAHAGSPEYSGSGLGCRCEHCTSHASPVAGVASPLYLSRSLRSCVASPLSGGVGGWSG